MTKKLKMKLPWYKQIWVLNQGRMRSMDAVSIKVILPIYHWHEWLRIWVTLGKWKVVRQLKWARLISNHHKCRRHIEKNQRSGTREEVGIWMARMMYLMMTFLKSTRMLSATSQWSWRKESKTSKRSKMNHQRSPWMSHMVNMTLQEQHRIKWATSTWWHQTDHHSRR